MKYTTEMCKFVQELRDDGYSWRDIETEFAEEFGEHRSHDTIRMSTKKFLAAQPEPIVSTRDVRPVKEAKPLPEYLLYTPSKKIKPGKGKSKGTTLVIPDCHIPYHDQRAYNLMIEVAKSVKDLNEIVILGDYADFYAINSHGKHPKFGHVLMDEIGQVRKELERLATLFPKAKRVFIQGNHEYRLERYVQNMCPDLFGVVDTKSILCLDELGYEFVPYGPNQKYAIAGGKLYARHEPIGGGQHAAASTVNKAGCSVIFGHIHRIQQHRKVFINGEDHLGASVGWLGDKDHEVMSYLKNHAQWQLGCAFVNTLDDGTFFLDTKHIINYTTMHNGKLFKG